jgi:hypothetical protein
MLDKHWDGGFLPVGWHRVTITDAKTINYNSGNEGVEFALQSEEGQAGKASFVLVDSILWRLAQFVKACGLTREQAAKYNEHSINHHRHMIGKMVQVQVVLGAARGDPPKRYAEVDNWLPMSEPTPTDAPAPAQAAPPAEEPKDDIPF